MTRVLKGEALGAEQIVIPLAVCVTLTALGVWYVARELQRAAVK